MRNLRGGDDVGFGNRGQVAIFIILAIVIVGAILVFFLWGGPGFFSDRVGIKGFEGCVEDAVDEGIVQLEGSAGVLNSDFTYRYNDEDFVYLCYTDQYYKTCTVQVPLLKKTFDESLETLVGDDITACYDASLQSLKDQGYEVVSGGIDFDIEIEPGQVVVKVDAPTSAGDQEFSRFSTKVNSPIYDMLMIATSIVQFEAEYGDSNTDSIALYYPDYYVEKVKRGDGTKVYILENKMLGDEFKFASRSLVFPAGFDF